MRPRFNERPRLVYLAPSLLLQADAPPLRTTAAPHRGSRAVTDSESPGSVARGAGAETPAAPSLARADAPRRRRFFVILIIAIVLVLVGALLWWLHARNYEGSDDAFVDARIAH